MTEIIPLFLIALICLGIGFLLGLFVSSLRLEKGNRSSSTGSTRPGTPDRPPVAPQAELEPVTPNTTTPVLQEAPALPISTKPERPSLNPVNMFARALQTGSKPHPVPAKSIAAQIDEILQEKLSHRSLDVIPAERRAIRLLELPGKGMVVMVGLERYEGVEGIPELAIRSLIREAVKDWEKSPANS